MQLPKLQDTDSLRLILILVQLQIDISLFILYPRGYYWLPEHAISANLWWIGGSTVQDGQQDGTWEVGTNGTPAEIDKPGDNTLA